MRNNYNFNLLREDFEQKKQIVLFVGAGINYSPDVAVLWDDVLNHLFKDALRHLALERGLSGRVVSLIKGALGIDGNVPEGISDSELHDWYRIHELADRELPVLVKASIIKSVLDGHYHASIQQYLYGQCDRFKLERAFMNYYRTDQAPVDGGRPFHTLYQLARIIILCPYIKAIVSDNYDNFLQQAIRILWNNRTLFFTEEELAAIGSRTLDVKDISGPIYGEALTENCRFIYHVHGYIQSPAEPRPLHGNRIVLSMDEYYESSREVYSWQNATQLHLLSHYTCIFAGLSVSDINLQRMLHYAGRGGGCDRVYLLNACSPGPVHRDYDKAYHAVIDIKNCFYRDCGLYPVFSRAGFAPLYEQFGRMVSETCIKHNNK